MSQHITAIFGRTVMPPKYTREIAAPFQDEPNPMLALARAEGHRRGFPSPPAPRTEKACLRPMSRLSEASAAILLDAIRNNPGRTSEQLAQITGFNRPAIASTAAAMAKLGIVVAERKAKRPVLWSAA